MKRNIYSTAAIVFYLLHECQSKDGGSSISSITTRKILPDDVNDEFDISELSVSRNNPENIRPKRSGGLTRSLARDPMDRQANVWETIGTMEAYKTASRLFSTSGSSDGRKTFSDYHFKIVPFYWNGMTSSQWTMDIESIRSEVQKAVDNHSSQSWGKLKITFEIVPQMEHFLPSAQSLAQTKWGAEKILSQLGYSSSADYDAIMVVYHPLGDSGEYCCSGGKAILGGRFGAVSYMSSWRTIRHEMGHYFGHYHHMHNHYNYRNSRPYPPSITDGFDMMSGGNGYDRSDFGIASKWYFNWVSDDHIVSLQPEGKTAACPKCLKSGTFTLKPFDNWWNLPGSNDLMGIHIPVMSQYDSYWETDLVYSYWLSYRTGVNGLLQNGLSVHVAWFELESNMQMGAYYDSMNYDVFGNTDDRSDSVVLVDTCYHIAPAPYLLDRDLISANAVQPVVCVDSINVGSDITISVNFIEPNDQTSPSIDVVERTVSCSTTSATSEAFVMDAKAMNLFHVDGMGIDGAVTVSLKSDARWSMAYFYDGFPYSPLIYGSDVAYGSMRRLGSASGPTDSPKSMTYTALFGEVYTIIPINIWAPNGSTVTATFSCKTTTCFPNEYKANDRCNQCPPDHRATQGATSPLQCWPCPDGTYLSHPHATECVVGQRTTLPPVPSPVASPTAKDDDDYYLDGPSPTKMPSASSSKRPSYFPPTRTPTSKPTKNPSNSPSLSPSHPPTSKPSPNPTPEFKCNENPRAQFLLTVVNGSPRTRSCKWLKSKSWKRKNALCSKSKTHSGFKSAKDVCVETCNICSSGTHADINADSTTEKFFLRTKVVGAKTFYIVKPCQWLKKNSPAKILNICGKGMSKFGIKSAEEVCPSTCALAAGQG